MSYNWKPGDRAVCIHGGSNGVARIVEGQIYTVLEVVDCGCCVSLDVGLRHEANEPCTCINGHYVSPRGTSYPHSQYFRPLDELEATMDRLEKEGCPTSLPQPELA